MHKTTCSKCKGPLESNRIGKYRYCNACHAEWMRNNRPSSSAMKPEARKKVHARSHSRLLRDRGSIVQQSCEVCGDPNTEIHHDDYNDRRNVRWFCRKHHMEWHINQEIFTELGGMDAERRGMLNGIMQRWAEHVAAFKATHPTYEPSFYGFAFWLVMWSARSEDQNKQSAA